MPCRLGGWGMVEPSPTPDLVMGQRLWAMFGVAILLVAGMNAYAVMREPDVVGIGNLIEHTNEVVRVEGTLTTWMRDPYGTGENRVDLIIEDDTGVVELRWFRATDLPPVGTKVTATGDVIEWDGRIYMQALGSGAVSWKQSDLPDVVTTSLADVAADPVNHSDRVLRLTGYIGEAVSPDASWTSAMLNDHPTYSNAEHHMKLIITSAPGRWIEHGARIQVDGLLQYDASDLVWAFHVTGPEVRVDDSHTPAIDTLDWDDQESWAYRSGAIVRLSGDLTAEGDDLFLSHDGTKVCFIPGEGDRDAAASLVNSTTTASGRLLWSTSKAMWCLDASTSDDLDLIDPTEVADLLGLLEVAPTDLIEDGQRHTVRLYARYAIAPGVEDSSTSFADSASYRPGWRTVTATVPGPRSDWIEAGQAIVAEVSVAWDGAAMRARLMVHDMSLDGDAPDPVQLLWDDGAQQWSYSRDMQVALSGVLTPDDNGGYRLHEAGGERSIELEPLPTSLALDELHANTTLRFIGRWSQVQTDDGLSMGYRLAAADVNDRDGDGLADGLEAVLGTNPNDEDSNDDGVSDRQELTEA